MLKGNFSVSLNVISVICFVFAILGQPVAVLIIAGFAILAEKEIWLIKHTLEALILYLLYAVLRFIIGGAFDFFRSFLPNGFFFQNFHSIMNSFESFLITILYLAFIVLCVFGIINAIRGKEGAVPGFSKITKKIIG